MDRRKKTLLGIASIIPDCQILFVICFVIYSVSGHEEMNTRVLIFIAIFQIIAMFLGLGMVFYYLRHTYKNSKFSSDQKGFWNTVLLFGNVLVLPIYWYHFIWKTDSAKKGYL